MFFKVYSNHYSIFKQDLSANRLLTNIFETYRPFFITMVDKMEDADIVFCSIKIDEPERLNPKQKLIARFDAIDINYLQGTKNLYNLANKMVFQAHYARDMFVEHFGERKVRYTLVPNGAELGTNSIKNISSDSKITMVSVGTWADIPGVPPYFPGIPKLTDLVNHMELFSKFCHKFPNLEWQIIGEYLPQEAVDLCRKFPQMKLVGRKETKDLFEILDKAHLMFHPGQYDVCPNAVVEAITHFLPIIYFPSGGMSELVAKAGIAINSYSAQEFEQSLEEMINNYSKYHKLVLRRARQLNISRISRLYWKFILL